MRILLTFAPAMIVTAAHPHEAARAHSDLKIDINVVLKQASVVFDMDHLPFAGANFRIIQLVPERFVQSQP